MQKYPKLQNSAVVLCGGRGGSEQLAIFGNPRARRGAELKAGSIFSAKTQRFGVGIWRDRNGLAEHLETY